MDSAFELQVPREQCNPRFLAINDHPGHRCTRRLIDELIKEFEDKDGEFIKRFQTSEFESRLWELYLFACLKEAAVTLDSTYNRPDFHGHQDGREFFIEAVTTNPPASGTIISAEGCTDADVRASADSHMMRVMRSVRRKVAKEYESLPWVHVKPLGIAVAPFHGPDSLDYTASHLQQFLWGMEPREDVDPNTGEMVRTLAKLDRRTIAGREIEFGWFQTAESGPASAIIYSIGGTIAKFHRIAIEKGFAEDDDVALVHYGLAHDPDPNAFVPTKFNYVVGQSSVRELWSDGLTVIHNPCATVGFPVNLFVSGMETLQEEGRMLSRVPGFHPYNSMTLMLSGRGSRANAQAVSADLARHLDGRVP